MRRHDEADQTRTGVMQLGLSRADWPLACWVFVLLAIGVVQVVREQWFDALVFGAATVGTLLVRRAAAARLAGPSRGLRPWLRLSWLIGAAAGVAVVMALLPRHGTAMRAAVIVAGIAAVTTLLSGSTVRTPDQLVGLTSGVQHLAIAWAVVLVAGCLWELLQFILGLVQPDAQWDSMSVLLDPLVAAAPGKVAAITAWLAGGVWLLRRGGVR